MKLNVRNFIASGKISGKNAQLKTHIPKEIQKMFNLKGGETLLFLRDEANADDDDEVMRFTIVIKKK